MSLSLEIRYYYFACSFLRQIFVALDMMYESGSTDYQIYQQRWDAEHDVLAGWLMSQAFAILDSIATSEGLSETLYDAGYHHVRPFLRRWSDTLLLQAHTFHVTYAPISESMWLYYQYCAWLRHTVNVFDQMMHAPVLHGTTAFQRYQTQALHFIAFAQRLQQEQPTVSAVPWSKRTRVTTLLADLERQAVAFAEEWRIAVMEAAEQLDLDAFRDAQHAALPIDDDEDVPF
jgi:hypothetical protein